MSTRLNAVTYEDYIAERNRIERRYRESHHKLKLDAENLGYTDITFNGSILYFTGDGLPDLPVDEVIQFYLKYKGSPAVRLAESVRHLTVGEEEP